MYVFGTPFVFYSTFRYLRRVFFTWCITSAATQRFDALCHTVVLPGGRWMAPEVIRHEPYKQTADVYSFGEDREGASAVFVLLYVLHV